MNGSAPDDEDAQKSEAEIETAAAIGQVLGELKTYARILSRGPEPMTQREEQRAKGWRGLVDVARELNKGDQGNQIIRDNAKLLAESYSATVMSTLDELADPAQSGGATDASPIPQSSSRSLTAPIPATAAPALWQAAEVRSGPPAEPLAPLPALPDEQEGESEPGADRRFVWRPASRHPKFSQMAETYLRGYETQAGKGSRDVGTARMRCELFAELIGDHPVDTYDGTDLQAFVDYLTYWPGDNNERPADLTPWEIIEDNRDLHLQPVAMKTLRQGYLSVVKRVIRLEMTKRGYRDPFSGVRLFYPRTAAPSRSAQPLSAFAISNIFRTGVAGGLHDEAILPLIGNLTGRRIGLLIYLTGNDIREKYPGVWVASTSGLVKVGGRWQRVPYKNEASTTFFVLNQFLHEIGFTEWARSKGDSFLFPHFHSLADPSKSASQYMQRLWRRAGIEPGNGEIFHSLRSGQIEELRDSNVDPRDRRLQVGHSVGGDQHDNYGFTSITEKRAREMARLPLNPDIDYSMFRGLDFEKMYQVQRVKGKRRR